MREDSIFRSLDTEITSMNDRFLIEMLRHACVSDCIEFSAVLISLHVIAFLVGLSLATSCNDRVLYFFKFYFWSIFSADHSRRGIRLVDVFCFLMSEHWRC